MRRASNKRAGKPSPASAAKKNKPTGQKRAAAEEDDDFFLGDDADAGRRQEDSEEEEEEEETAEQLRLRVAREFLSHLGEEEGGHAAGRRGRDGDTSDDEEEGEGEEEDDEGAPLSKEALRERLAQRLKQDAAQAQGRLQRKVASRVCVLAPGDEGYSEPACARGHRLAATAVALTSDDATAFTASKDGSICKWDVETMKRTNLYRPGDGPSTSGSKAAASSGPDWVAKRARAGSKAALYAAAVSSDGHLLAVGGGDNKVHVFDAKAGTFIQAHSGHKDSVTGLAFREGTHTLYSCSTDRTVKLWSLDDRAYMDTLFGHQAEVLAVDALRPERVLTAGHDHTCRVWKVPEESQLIFRAHDRALECVKYVTPTEWISGGSDGALHLWSQMKKKPIFVARHAHGPSAGQTYAAPAGSPPAAGLAAEHGWVTSVAVCRGSDLVASGAGDGAVRLWTVEPSGKTGGAGRLSCLGAVGQRGFVNGLAISRSARFLVTATGQEPRMGRWARDGKARNGLAVHRLHVSGPD